MVCEQKIIIITGIFHYFDNQVRHINLISTSVQCTVDKKIQVKKINFRVGLKTFNTNLITLVLLVSFGIFSKTI